MYVHILSGTTNPSLSDFTELVPYFIVNKYGQIGIAKSVTFMQGLSSLSNESTLYVNGGISAGAIQFTSTEFINGDNGSLNFFSGNKIVYNAPVLFNTGK